LGLRLGGHRLDIVGLAETEPGERPQGQSPPFLLPPRRAALAIPDKLNLRVTASSRPSGIRTASEMVP
jgi:hypothetical protein